ncbi:MAG: CPBP family intramembrane metalloprotease [Coriobacteriales bacterium]|nr:CPBP family intramembrane metalloprotease [Coriobacteriales bacterium]
MRRIIIFCVLTFAITFGLEIGLIYRMYEMVLVGNLQPAFLQFAIVAMMFMPAIGVVLTRLITKEGFKNAMIKPVAFKRTFKYYLLGWFGPTLLICLGAIVYFVIFPSDFDLMMTNMVEVAQQQYQLSGVNPPNDDAVRATLWLQLAIGALAGPLLNFITCFGEEWGWRGYLLPKVNEHLSFIPTTLLVGVIWGLWHAPLTIIGHNYGLVYAGYPYLGIFAMCCFCIVVGTFLSYITLKAKSCLPAVFGHAALNSFASAALMFSASGGNPFIGPLPVGLIGGSGLIATAVLIWVVMRKAPRWAGFETVKNKDSVLTAEVSIDLPLSPTDTDNLGAV